MTALPQEAPESEEQLHRPILIAAPQIIVRDAVGTQDADTIAARVAREQEELAVLQHALVRCGMLGDGKHDEE